MQRRAVVEPVGTDIAVAVELMALLLLAGPVHDGPSS